MRKENPVRYSSAVGEAWMHCEFKIKYCHDIFDDEICREGMRTLLLEASYKYEIPLGVIGFDSDHVHFMADIGLYDRPEVAKLLRGYTAKKFFEYFPDIKQKYFWDSGFWNPSYWIGSPKNVENTIKYIQSQKYGELSIKNRAQRTLASFASSASARSCHPVCDRW